MPRTKEQGGPRGRTSEPRASLYWKRGYAYGNFTAWEKWGGRLEGLKPDGATTATTEPTEAAILFGRRLEALRELRSRHPNGLAAASWTGLRHSSASISPARPTARDGSARRRNGSACRRSA